MTGKARQGPTGRSHLARAWLPALLVLLGAVTLLAACGSGSSAGAGSVASRSPSTTPPTTAPPPLRVTGRTTAALPEPPASRGPGPAPDQQDLAFTPGGTGFLVTGWLGGGTGEIQRTTDGGKSWQTVWTKAGAALYWVGTTGNEVRAAGTYAAPGNDPNEATPLLLDSVDGGASWTSVTPSLPPPPEPTPGGPVSPSQDWASLRLEFPTATLGLAVTDASEGQAVLDHRLLRSTDGGRHWSEVGLPGGQPDGGLVFTNALHGFATGLVDDRAGHPGGGSCTSQIWSTADGGATWRAVPGTCVAWLADALSFPDATHGFAAGGNFSKYGMFPQRAVLATADGGSHWSQVYAGGGNASGGGPDNDGPFAGLDFVNPNVGYALVGGCTMGANGPCGGSLWSTTDGGRQWTTSSASGLRLAVAGPADLWLTGAGPGGGSVMWHSTDGARSWTAVADPGDVDISGLAGSGASLWVDTTAGQFLSGDGGATWSPVPPAALAAEHGGQDTVVAAGPAGLLAVGSFGAQAVWISHDAGRRGTSSVVPDLGRDGGVALAFADARRGLALGQGAVCAKGPAGTAQGGAPFTASAAAVVATVDGGSSWHGVGRLDLTPIGLGYGPKVAVAVGTGPGPTPPCPTEVATSTDGGAHWRMWSMPAGYRCGAPSVGGDTAVLVCPGPSSSTTTLLVSRDAGRTWTARQLEGGGQVDTVVATGSSQIWADGPPGTLWHSTDAGAHWSVRTPALPVVP